MNEDRQKLADEVLVMDAQDRDKGAMDELVRRWQKPLWRHACRLTQDCDAAWDVTQQSWMAIIKSLPKLHDPARFKSWAYRITTYKAADWVRKNKRLNRIDLEQVKNLGDKEKQDAPITELLQKLDMTKRSILSLYYFERLSVAEISVALRIPKGTVKSRLHTARSQLRELWKEHVE